MKVHKYQANEERSILTAMLVHDRVLGKIARHSKKETDLFRSKWANLVAGWCLDYFKQYQQAPRKSIHAIFRHHAQKTQDEQTTELLERFLSGLSEDYETESKEINEDYTVDLAVRYFNRVQVEREKDSIEADLMRGDVDAALGRFNAFRPFQFGTDDIVNVLTDRDALFDAISAVEEEPLVRYGGALGEFFGPHLGKDCFVSFLAPDKRGKSFWLVDAAWRAAILNKRRTLLYSVGDMTRRQMMKRLIARAARRPIEAGEVTWPKRLRRLPGGETSVKVESKHHSSRISLAEARRAMQVVRRKTAHTSSLLKLRCTPNDTTKVSDIEADIEKLAQEGWVAEVVVVDYMDILAMEGGTEEHRHRIDETWKAMRRLSQKYHVLVVTATQSNAAGYDKATLSRRNFSDDKRKLAHVTGMVGINQLDPEEKNQGIFRLNWIVLREGSYTESKCVTTAGSLGLSNPAMVSCW